MGIYDREYYRDDRPRGFELSGGWSMTTWLIIVNAAVFLINVVTDDWIVEQFSATATSLTRPYLAWQFVTYGFTHDPNGIGHVFWNMFGLWVFGQAVEAIYGPREFLRIYLVSVVLGGVFWAVRVVVSGDHSSTYLLGASGAVTAVTLLFCIHYPKQTIRLMMVIPVPAWLVGAMIILANIQGVLSGERGTAFDVHLVGAALAIGYYTLGWNFGRWLPDGSWPRMRWPWRKSPRLRVHQPTDFEDPDEGELDHTADRLLEKISREGIESLSAAERATLERHSRRMRDKRR